MAKILREHFRQVHASDAYDYRYGEVRDYLRDLYEPGAFDWVITNPPFRLAEQFIHQSLSVARRGVAILARTTFVEGVGRHKRLFRDTPPTLVAPFSERVPMVKGRLDRKATTATSYARFVWDKGCRTSQSQIIPVPPCRKELERDGDYPPALVTNTGEGVEAVPVPDHRRRKPEQLLLF
jgi:hypothetical protein